jgi:HD-GYP domain-containing protein (c-di-GMP phosphodiesterase class II)
MTNKAIVSVPAEKHLIGYSPINAVILLALDSVAADLFVQYDFKKAPVLYCKAGQQLNSEHLLKLNRANIQYAYVRSAEFKRFSAGLQCSIEAILQRTEAPPTAKFAALQLAAAHEFEHALRQADCSEICCLARQVGSDLVELVATGELVASQLFAIARHDFDTFAHVSNVASYSIILAKRLGFNDEGVLHRIATGAILHDIGKRHIPANLLSKPTKLSKDERDLIQSHPLRGYVEVCRRHDLELGQLMMIYQHHEHIDGSGYPVGILGDEIHPWAKMLAVVDVFDAMTAKRPYRRPEKIEYVLDYQQRRAGTHFDPEIVRLWIPTIAKR